MTSLYDATKDLHHACEAHPLGSRMSKGNVTPQEWADWLWAFQCLHSVIDLQLPEHMARGGLLTADLSVLPTARPSSAALLFASSLVGKDVTGAAYVLHGAHRSGGRVMAPVLAKRALPCAHIAYKDPDGAKDWIRGARESDSVLMARETFQCLLSTMDEIMRRDSC
jgi:heme oxygenase